MNKMDIQTTGTIKEGKERYRSGVIPYKNMGYWEPDYGQRTPTSSRCSG